MDRRLLSHSNNFNTFPQKLLLKWKYFLNKTFFAKTRNYAKSGFSNEITLHQKMPSQAHLQRQFCAYTSNVFPPGLQLSQLMQTDATQHPSRQLWVFVSWGSSCFMSGEQSLAQRLPKLNISCGSSPGLSWEIFTFRSIFGSILKPGKETGTSSPTTQLCKAFEPILKLSSQILYPIHPSFRNTPAWLNL